MRDDTKDFAWQMLEKQDRKERRATVKWVIIGIIIVILIVATPEIKDRIQLSQLRNCGTISCKVSCDPETGRIPALDTILEKNMGEKNWNSYRTELIHQVVRELNPDMKSLSLEGINTLRIPTPDSGSENP